MVFCVLFSGTEPQAIRLGLGCNIRQKGLWGRVYLIGNQLVFGQVMGRHHMIWDMCMAGQLINVMILSSPDYHMIRSLVLSEPSSRSTLCDTPPIYIYETSCFFLSLFSSSLFSFRSFVQRQYLGDPDIIPHLTYLCLCLLHAVTIKE